MRSCVESKLTLNLCNFDRRTSQRTIDFRLALVVFCLVKISSINMCCIRTSNMNSFLLCSFLNVCHLMFICVFVSSGLRAEGLYRVPANARERELIITRFDEGKFSF